MTHSRATRSLATRSLATRCRPLALLLAVLLVAGCQPVTPAAPPATDTVPPPTAVPVTSAPPTSAPATAPATDTAAPPAGGTTVAPPSATPTGTRSPNPETIWIQSAEFSNGMLTVAGEAEPTFEQNLVVHVLDIDGTVLAEEPTTIQAPDLDQRGAFSVTLRLPPSPEPASVQVFSTSARDGGVTHLASAEILGGRFQPGPNREAILIREPVLTQQVASPVFVAGEADTTFEQTLLVEVFDAAGALVGSGTAHINAELGQRGEFSATVPITATVMGPGRVSVSSSSPRDGHVMHLSSVEVQIGER